MSSHEHVHDHTYDYGGGYGGDYGGDYGQPGERRGSGRHPLSTAYLVAGLVFLGIAAAWALRAAEVIDDEGSKWIAPVVLVVAGVAGLVASLTRSALPRRAARGGSDELPPFDEPGGDDGDEADRGAGPLAR